MPGVAARFHHTMSEVMVEVARRAGKRKVALSGGCFQNRYLLEDAISRLRRAGFQPVWHRHLPPNDGGLALGQAIIAAHSLLTTL